MSSARESGGRIYQAKDLLKSLDKHPLPPVLLICPGTAGFNREPFDGFLAERVAQAIVDNYVDPSMRDLAYSAFDAEEAKVGEIVMEAETMPFLVERRVILVRNAERYMMMASDKKAPLAPLLRYLENPSDTTLLVFVADAADKRKKFYTSCKESGALVECAQLTDGELGQWVREIVGAAGKQIGTDAVNELLSRAGGRLGDVNNAASLLVTFVGDSVRIEEKDVVAACADVAEETVWQLTNAIGASKSDVALQSLHQLLDHGKSPDEIMGTINWMLESAYKAAPFTKATPPHRFVLDKVLPLAEKLGPVKLIEALAACTKTHFMIRNTGVDKNLALELLVIKLAFPRKKPAKSA